MTVPAIALHEGRRLAGVVLDEAGGPAEGALVAFEWTDENGETLTVDTRSESNGRFELVDLGPGPGRLIVTAAGFVQAERTHQIPTEGVEVRLEPGRSVAGKVVDPEGEPVDGAWVYPAAGVEGGVARSDESGRFLLEGVSEGVELRAWHPEYMEAAWKWRQTGDSQAVMVLEPGAVLIVRVRDGKSGEPIADATVAVDGAPSLWTTNPSGEVLCHGLIPTQVPVWVWAPGYGNAFREVWLSGEEPQELSIPLDRSPRVSGLVLDPDGQPVVGARVDIEHSRYQTVSVATGEDGTFEAFVSSATRHLVVTAEGFAPGEVVVDPQRIGKAQAEIRVVLQPGAEVKGRVVDAQGRPIPRALVAEGDTDFRSLTALVGFGTEPRPVTSDEGGRFLVSGLSGGRHWFSAEAQGYAPGWMPDVEVPDAGSVDVGDIVLDEGVAVTGVVVDDAGKPVAGALVRRGFGEGGDSVLTAPDGTFQFDATSGPEDEVWLAVQAAGFLTEVPTVIPKDGRARIVLSRAHRISGSVRDRESGAPIRAFTIEGAYDGDDQEDPGSSEREDFVSPDGRFEIGDLPAREVELTARAPGYVADRTSVQVGKEEEAVTGVDFALIRGLCVSGVAIDEHGAPLAGVRVSNSSSELDEYFFGLRKDAVAATTGASGEFLLAGLKPGPVTITATLTGYNSESRTFELHDDVDDVEFVLNSGASVTGTVLGPDGLPVQGAEVAVTEWPGNLRYQMSSGTSAVTDERGSFEIRGVSPGSYYVGAIRGDDESSTVKIVVGGETPAPVELRFLPKVRLEGRVIGLRPDLLEVLEVSVSGAGWDDVRLDGSGGFVFEALQVGRRTVHASAGALDASEEVVLRADQTVAHVDLIMPPPGPSRLQGRVTRAGQPIPGAHIDAEWRGGTFESEDVETSDADGMYEFSNLWDGTYRLVVSGSVSPPLSLEVEVSGETTFDIELPSEVLRGVVRDESGQPIEGASVAIDGSFYDREETEADGRFELENVAPEGHLVEVSAPGFASQTRVISVPTDSDLEVTLPPESPLVLRIVDAVSGNEPVSAEYAVIRDEPCCSYCSATLNPLLKVDGGFQVPGLGPGQEDIVVVVRGRAPALLEGIDVPGEASVTVDWGGTIEIRESPRSCHTLTLATMDGDPVWIAEQGWVADGTSMADEVTIVGPLAPGLYRVSLRGAAPKTGTVTVKTGERVTLELQ